MKSSFAVRQLALAQAALDHGDYFLDLGETQRAAAYFRFAAEHLDGLSNYLLATNSPSPIEARLSPPDYN